MPAPDDFSDRYNTPIPPAKQAAFQQYMRTKGRPSDYYDYDVQGDWLAGAKRDERNHGSDQFKKPNHPTFSTQSQYSTPENPGGQWVTSPGGQSAFVAHPSNLTYHSPDELQQYFKDVEPATNLYLPPDAPGPAKPPLPAGLQAPAAGAAAAPIGRYPAAQPQPPAPGGPQ